MDGGYRPLRRAPPRPVPVRPRPIKRELRYASKPPSAAAVYASIPRRQPKPGARVPVNSHSRMQACASAALMKSAGKRFVKASMFARYLCAQVVGQFDCGRIVNWKTDGPDPISGDVQNRVGASM